MKKLCFVLLVTCVMIFTGLSGIYAVEYIDGGVAMDATAPILTSTFSYIKTYTGNPGEPAYFRIIPTVTENYTIETSGSVDTEGQLFYSDGSEYGLPEDFGGDGDNFKMNKPLQAGNLYYLRVINYSGIPGDQTTLKITGDGTGELSAPAVITMTDSGKKLVYKSGDKIRLSGMVSDGNGDNVTISASINSKPATVVITGGNGPWTLEWDIDLLSIADGTYKNIVVTADDGSSAEPSTATHWGDIVVDKTAPAAPTSVSVTPVGGTVVANSLNKSNTNLTASASITAADATGGKAELYLGSTLLATDNTINDTDTQVTFDLGLTLPANLQAAIPAGGVISVKLYDGAGNSSVSSGNPTLEVDYVTPPPEAPTAAVNPITGSLKVGETLTGHYTYSDANGDAEGASTFKWYRADDSAGSGKTAITGATAKTYVLQPGDLGKYISFEVTPVAATGTFTQGTAVESAWTGAVAPAEAAPTATGAAITGTLQVGETLTGSYTYSDINGDAEGSTTFKWYSANNSSGSGKTTIPGATAKDYVLQPGDLGKYISFEVTPVAAAGIAQGTPVESAWTGAVVPAEAAPTATGAAITGTLQVGKTLTGSYTYGDVNGDAEGTTTFKWYRADDAAGSGKTAIAGATAKTYVLQPGDLGKYISFEVIPVAATGIALGAAVESAWTGAVVPAEAAPTATGPAITGTLQVGETLTGSYDYSDINGDFEGASTFKWYRADDSVGSSKTAIAGATAKTYVLQPSDLGKYISFEVTPIAATGIAQGTTVESAWTGVVVPAEAAPTATAPAITGTLQVGETLTGSYTYSDVNGDLEGASTFKWYRADDSAGSGKTDIAGATSKTYVLQPGDLGKYISFEVTPVAATGIAQGAPVESAWIGKVVPAEAAPTATGAAITGTPQVGETLTGHYNYSDINGDLEGTTNIKWYRADNSEGGGKTAIAEGTTATAITYVLQDDDLHKYISFEVTPVAATGITQGTAVESAWTGKVVPAEAAPTATGAAITGTLKVGETLTGHYTYNDVNGDAEGVSTFKWYRAEDAAGSGKTAITVATTAAIEITYTLQPEDLGKYISFEVTPVAAAGIAQGIAVESPRVEIIITHAAPPIITAQPQNTTVTVGNAASLSVAATASGILSYQWYSSTQSAISSGQEIQNATGASIQLQTNTAGTNYYYCVLTNTDASMTGTTTATTTSAIAQVTVNNAPVTPYTPSTPAAPQKENTPGILINGKELKLETITTSEHGGERVVAITMDSQKLEEKLDSEQKKSVITIPLGDIKADAGVLTGDIVKELENNEAVFEISNGNATYMLPAKLIDIDAMAEQLDAKSSLGAIKVKIKVSKASAENEQRLKKAAEEGGFSIQVAPVDFSVECSVNGRSIAVNNFSAYVERTLEIPSNVDADKITTGVVVDPDGTVRHVPTTVINNKGKYYAKINSLTNSSYAVIYNPLEFADANRTPWAKAAINDMGSRLVITNGIDDNMFNPKNQVTRGEFAAFIVNALGLKPETGKNIFKDVEEKQWYSGHINTAYEYGLISGKGSNKFAPEDKITREQAMIIITKAMSVIGFKPGLNDDETDVILSGYKDAASIARGARYSVAVCVKTGLVTGKENSLIAPKQDITRAEIAVIIQKLLKQSGLI